jgi:hypothetical protein
MRAQHAAVGVDGVVGVDGGVVGMGWLVGQLCDVGSGGGESWAWHENGREMGWPGLAWGLVERGEGRGVRERGDERGE